MPLAAQGAFALQILIGVGLLPLTSGQGGPLLGQAVPGRGLNPGKLGLDSLQPGHGLVAHGLELPVVDQGQELARDAPSRRS